ncbi:MAG: 23S rRNA (pseudouridine(1915)-N(3))-methyltransferase RlmH [Candidatus Magasanikbacteria bacterium CG10_big_fil_rev_8_21_14_0_10_36_16]|uniref:Ribosomal RNA large subunit methyltransferase H n=1 Tax=Candidatus Magasanikbacteria bacterium CG10_big_fil_rev_8_21_14_0_10_36_16 TaxID=1974645 RepID=A0A2H0TZ85_9BACT|nr:MAG: 23S rRNA (pseudouridine(1915)-N(3))-methyltransferase RlmH [Candidatus Magasanikbacteria bacterium CG10_big_fil_rev_8_21_14_0_10_36_16]
MYKINIITLGKLKEKYWSDAEQEYLKRLSIFTKTNIIELKEEKFDEKSNHEVIKEKEAEKILKAIHKNSYVIVLDKEGKQFSSEELSKKIIEFKNSSTEISFVIGGPLGLAESILNIAKEKWSFSKLTFTHQMMRVILLEQIYRSFMISEDRKYHW